MYIYTLVHLLYISCVHVHAQASTQYILCLYVKYSVYACISMWVISSPGVVGTVKAIISESSNNRTQALGMSLITCAFSLGLIVGPAVSGVLADPIGQYNLTISGTALCVCACMCVCVCNACVSVHI